MEGALRCETKKDKDSSGGGSGKDLSAGVELTDHDSAEGWTVADEGLIPLRARGWDKPTLLAGRRAGKAVMEFIRGGKLGKPWITPTIYLY